VLVNLWKHPSRHNSEVGPLLQQIDDLSRGFVDFSFVFSSRTCNKLAHECAKLVSRDRSAEEWLVPVPPPALRGIADNDCNHVHDE
jgi:superfamily II RNA helicase